MIELSYEKKKLKRTQFTNGFRRIFQKLFYTIKQKLLKLNMQIYK